MVFRQLAKDSAIYGGADLVSKTINFFTFPFIAKALSPESFGFLELILTSTALLGVMGNFGLNNSLQRFYWDPEVQPSDRKELVSSGLIAQVLILSVLLVLAAGICLVFFPEVGTAYAFTWLGVFAALLLMAANQWTQYLLDVIRLQFRPWSFLTVSMISRVLSAVLGLIAVVYLGKGIDGLLGAQAVVVILVLPVALFIVKNEFSIASFSKKWAKELLQYGYPFIFSALAYWIFTSQDRWMLASFSSVEEVGIYSVSFRFASVILFVSAAFGQAWSPVAMKIRADHPESYPKIYGDVLMILIFGMALIAGVIGLFSGEIIHLLMGEEYLKSALPMVLLAFAIVFQASQQITGIGISLEKRTILFAHLSWVTTVINFGLNWILIPQYGALGASWATAISYLFLTGSYFFFTQRFHPIKISYTRLTLILAMTFAVIFLSFWFYKPELFAVTILIKIGLIFAFLGLGLSIIPLKNMKNV
ncbi:flippase [Algoriphagus sp.]|uniref:flippase n=1 Tax=Algoriphagus sp. TaxID=1872435 RepID=UPI003919BD7A